MKVESKQIVPLLDSIRGLIDDFQDGFREIEDVEQSKECFDTLHGQLKALMSNFRIDHMTPVTKPSGKSIPDFVRLNEKRLDREQGRLEYVKLTSFEDMIQFKAEFYFKIKRKLVSDGVDHLLTRDRVHFHIQNYLVGNDPQLDHYLHTNYDVGAYNVIDTIVDEIMEHRRKHPQLTLEMPVADQTKSKKLLDTLY